MIIYLHGFGSNGNAFKARLMRRLYPAVELLSPDLPHEPEQAIDNVGRLIRDHCDRKKILLIGSSLGGFYALHLCSSMSVSAVLLNPTIRPLHDLDRKIQTGSQSSDQLIKHWRDQHRKQLERYWHAPDTVKGTNLLVYLNRDDEILDYRIAESYFRQTGCRIIINDNGGHVFLNFTQVLPEIMTFYDQL
jgi:predicted esterase YcpF (UPF0227 family)